MAPELSGFLPYVPPPLDRHVFTPERSLSPSPNMRDTSQSPDVGDTSGEEASWDDILDSDGEVEGEICIQDGAKEDILEDTIPKPNGSTGRPSSGGYSLADVLEWDTKFYKSVQEFLQGCVRERLDLSKAFRDQDAELIADICREADKKFPSLKQYIDRWPTKDFLYTSHKNIVFRNKNQKSRTVRPESRLLRKRHVSFSTGGPSGKHGKHVN